MFKPLSNIEIDEYLKILPNYRGIYMSDQLPNKILPDEITVVNLDVKKNMGTHWCLIYNSSKLPYVIYIDPFGIIPNTKTANYLKTSGKEILYNTSQIQNMMSVMCGYYCIFFAFELSNGRNIYDVIYYFSTNDEINEILIKDYFMR